MERLDRLGLLEPLGQAVALLGLLDRLALKAQSGRVLAQRVQRGLLGLLEAQLEQELMKSSGKTIRMSLPTTQLPQTKTQ
jgi:hypothetical protein